MNKFFALIFLLFLSPAMFLIEISIAIADGFPILFHQKRVGKDNRTFEMYKFRTMIKATPNVATHLLDNPEHYLIPGGVIIRKLSLDELPNLINIIRGEMTFIGPRPALYNQYDLIEMRTKEDIHRLKPGVTGWAQVNGRDEIPLEKKVELDRYYLQHKSFSLNMKIIYLTFFKSLRGEGVTH
jgi:O-antigen biosynthesis protein WbqP